MTPQELRRRIACLPEDTPRHKALERELGEGVGFRGAWYRSQKEHWLGWLAEYAGPGAYGRQDATPRSAKAVWNRIQCAPMLFWLAEALNLPEAELDHAFLAVTKAPRRNASQCAALRKVFPWEVIEHALPPATLARRILSRLSGE